MSTYNIKVADKSDKLVLNENFNKYAVVEWNNAYIVIIPHEDKSMVVFLTYIDPRDKSLTAIENWSDVHSYKEFDSYNGIYTAIYGPMDREKALTGKTPTKKVVGMNMNKFTIKINKLSSGQGMGESSRVRPTSPTKRPTSPSASPRRTYSPTDPRHYRRQSSPRSVGESESEIESEEEEVTVPSLYSDELEYNKNINVKFQLTGDMRKTQTSKKRYLMFEAGRQTYNIIKRYSDGHEEFIESGSTVIYIAVYAYISKNRHIILDFWRSDRNDLKYRFPTEEGYIIKAMSSGKLFAKINSNKGTIEVSTPEGEKTYTVEANIV